jgi:hypothetical protein
MRPPYHWRWPQIPRNLKRSQTTWSDSSRKIPSFGLIICLRFAPNWALNQKNAARAIETLRAASPYELMTPVNPTLPLELYPVFVRGQAYLEIQQGSEAATEFQKILDHRGLVNIEPIGALAHLQLGCAYAMQGDTAKSRVAYQDFLTLWKDADPDIPILIAAKAEFANLH